VAEKPPLSVTWMVTIPLKVSDGVPEIAPVPFGLVAIVNPGGKPLATDEVPSGEVLVVVFGTFQV
jgi:hypothetical protein